MQASDAALLSLTKARRGAVGRDWRALSADQPPFLRPEFFMLERSLDGNRAPALVAVAWEGERLIGALPLVHEGERLVALTGEHTPAFDFCGTHDGLEAIWRMLTRASGWSRLVLDNVPVGSPLTTELPALARRDGHPVIVRARSRHPRFALQGFAARMVPKFRSNVQRCERNSSAELERIVSPSRAELDEAFAIEALGWKGRAGTSIAADPRVAHLYRALLRLHGRRGQACLYFLRAEGKRIGMLLAIEDATTLYALKIGHDPAAAAWSPGHLLVWKVAAEAERRGLATFDFVGRDDEWKRKWTEDASEHVTVTVYRRSPRGLAEYALRERVKPWAERQQARIPHTCQRADLIGVHDWRERVTGRLVRGLGIRSGIRRWIKRPARPERLGAPSAFAEGAWVRVRDEASVRATLDGKDRLRGLAFVPAQTETCGHVYRVARVMRRMRDDHGRMRPISRTVLLEGVTCDGGATGNHPAGCGRHCPLMYRDEWLEPATAPKRAPTPVSTRARARVRSVEEITATLDRFGRRDGVRFMPEMAQHAGKRVTIASALTRVFELDHWVDTPHPVYLLEGLHCTGAVLGANGPCHRACLLLWHEDWLVIEP